jgi:hypothetical protein
VIILELGWASFPIVIYCALGLLIVTLLHQRFIKRRSWRSILLGERPRDV